MRRAVYGALGEFVAETERFADSYGYYQQRRRWRDLWLPIEMVAISVWMWWGMRYRTSALLGGDK